MGSTKDLLTQLKVIALVLEKVFIEHSVKLQFEIQNGKAKKETNKTKHAKPEVYSTKLINKLNGMV